MDEYPKYLPHYDVVAQSKAEHDALLEGRAEVACVLKSAQGDKYAIVPKAEVLDGYAVTLDAETGPFTSEPAEMIAAAQETFTRRKSKRKGK